MQLLFVNARIFETAFFSKCVDVVLIMVFIEVPLLRSNNVNTVATLLRFNGMVSRSIYEMLGLVPEFISSYDARKYGFPDLMETRTHDKHGVAYSEKVLAKKHPVLFGGYELATTDKKMVVWEKVADLEPQIIWERTKKKSLAKENFDMTDAYTCVRAVMMIDGTWS